MIFFSRIIVGLHDVVSRNLTGIFCFRFLIFHCSCALYHRNLFGRNQKINLSLERGQIDSIFRINYTDPWIEGDDKRTSRTIMIQVLINFFNFVSVIRHDIFTKGDNINHPFFFVVNGLIWAVF